MKKRILFSIILALISLYVPINAGSAPLSTAFNNLAAGIRMTQSSPAGETVRFSASDFDECVGAEVRSVTILSVPSSAFGKLALGVQPVIKGQTVSRDYLDMLRFEPTDAGETVCAFAFCARTEGAEYELLCEMKLTGSPNEVETFGVGSVTALGLHAVFPAGSPTRAEFTACAMAAAGYDLSDVVGSRTSFWDDEDIPDRFAAYVAEAKRIGAVCGSPDIPYGYLFRPNDPITAGEARAVASHLLDGDKEVFLDLGADPSAPLTSYGFARIVSEIASSKKF